MCDEETWGGPFSGGWEDGLELDYRGWSSQGLVDSLGKTGPHLEVVREADQ